MPAIWKSTSDDFQIIINYFRIKGKFGRDIRDVDNLYLKSDCKFVWDNQFLQCENYFTIRKNVTFEYDVVFLYQAFSLISDVIVSMVSRIMLY